MYDLDRQLPPETREFVARIRMLAHEFWHGESMGAEARAYVAVINGGGFHAVITRVTSRPVSRPAPVESPREWVTAGELAAAAGRDPRTVFNMEIVEIFQELVFHDRYDDMNEHLRNVLGRAALRRSAPNFEWPS